MSGLSALTPNSSKHCGQDVTQARVAFWTRSKPRCRLDATTAQAIGLRAAKRYHVGEVHPTKRHDDPGQIGSRYEDDAWEPLASTAVTP